MLNLRIFSVVFFSKLIHIFVKFISTHKSISIDKEWTELSFQSVGRKFY